MRSPKTVTYRNAEAALRERTRLLSEERASLETQRREGDAIEHETKRLEKKLADTKTLLERFEQKRALPMLDQVKIASPCSADWSAMQGDDKSRYCGKCEKNVYNLSAMTREEADLLMLEREGELCVRLYRRKDGTVLTQDCPVGVRRKRLRLVGVLAMGGSVAAALAGFGAQRTLHPETDASVVEIEAVQGALYIPTETIDASVAPTMGTVTPPPPPPPKAAPVAKPAGIQKAPQMGKR